MPDITETVYFFWNLCDASTRSLIRNSVLAGTQKSATFCRKFLFCLWGYANVIHRLKYGYSSQKRNSQTSAKSFPSGIYRYRGRASDLNILETLTCLLSEFMQIRANLRILIRKTWPYKGIIEVACDNIHYFWIKFKPKLEWEKKAKDSSVFFYRHLFDTLLAQLHVTLH